MSYTSLKGFTRETSTSGSMITAKIYVQSFHTLINKYSLVNSSKKLPMDLVILSLVNKILLTTWYYKLLMYSYMKLSNPSYTYIQQNFKVNALGSGKKNLNLPVTRVEELEGKLYFTQSDGYHTGISPCMN